MADELRKRLSEAISNAKMRSSAHLHKAERVGTWALSFTIFTCLFVAFTGCFLISYERRNISAINISMMVGMFLSFCMTIRLYFHSKEIREHYAYHMTYSNLNAELSGLFNDSALDTAGINRAITRMEGYDEKSNLLIVPKNKMNDIISGKFDDSLIPALKGLVGASQISAALTMIKESVKAELEADVKKAADKVTKKVTKVVVDTVEEAKDDLDTRLGDLLGDDTV